MAKALQLTDIQKAFYPVTGFDAAGEAVPLPETSSIVVSSDDTSVAQVSVSLPSDPDGQGIIITSVGDDQVNVGDALVSSSIVDGEQTMALEDIAVGVTTSALASVGFGEPVITDR